MIVIIDYGMGNLGSIVNMIKKLGYECTVSSNIDEILNAKKLILPGVGSFDQAIKNLEKLNLVNCINKQVLENKVPILGICLGMQLLTNGSEEGTVKGLSYVDAYASKFKKDLNLRVPHMGWNILKVKKENIFFDENFFEQRFYFVHSFSVHCSNSKDILTTTNYGMEFVSSFQKENILGVQFHPEKSHKFGMHFFRNFLEKF